MKPNLCRIVVIGGGVSGLTVAVRCAEAGYPVTVWTADPWMRTTSAVAPAIWGPFMAEPRKEVEKWSSESRTVYESFATAERDAGIQLRAGRIMCRSDRGGSITTERTETYPVIDTSVYLPWLIQRAQGRGVEIVSRRIVEWREAFKSGSVIISCTGLAARDLANDSSLYPVRGQLVRVIAPAVNRFYEDCDDLTRMTYIVPRTSDVIIGGTCEPEREDTVIDAEVGRQLFDRALKVEPGLQGARVVEHKVGLRPARPKIRLEVERLAEGPIIHNYGHGGAGVTLAWGCASEVLGLVSAL